jgi:hypothetical protein
MKLRLIRRGEPVRINSDPAERLHGVTVSSPGDQETVKRRLGDICMLFEDGRTSQPCSSTWQVGRTRIFRPGRGCDSGVLLRDPAKPIQQKRTNSAKKAALAIYDKKQFNEAITDLTTTDLTTRQHPDGSLHRSPGNSGNKICEIKITEISASADEQHMTMLKNTASGVAGIMKNVVTHIIERASGNTYEALQMLHQSKLMAGNLYVDGAQPAQMPDPGHSYMYIVSLGYTTGLLGDQHGGKVSGVDSATISASK